jgi:hypothetical protein
MIGKGTDHSLKPWVDALPIRWGAGRPLARACVVPSSLLLQGGFTNPVGGHLAASIRVPGLIVLPLAILGFVWGWTERIGLKRQTVAAFKKTSPRR